MAGLTLPTPEARKSLQDAIDRDGWRATARRLGVARETLGRVIAGGHVSGRTLVALDRIAPRVRKADEFGSATSLRAPTHADGRISWTIKDIRCATDDQIAGRFYRPVQLAKSMRRDDALFNAYRLRVLPQSAVATKLVPANGARGEIAARKAAVSVQAPSSVLAGIHGTLANHAIAIGYVEHATNDDGTRTDLRLTEWPLDAVFWNPTRRVLQTNVYSGPQEDIIHGDGQWIVFRGFRDEPWTQLAAVLPGGLVWASRAESLKDWNASTDAHGSSKVLGKMPKGMALKRDDGTFEPEAASYLQTLADVITGAMPAGIVPNESEANFLTNTDTAWQIFKELTENRDKAASRIYLGTDAILGSTGGAPGVDIGELFKIANSILQADLQIIEQALRTGLYEPWCAINYGDSQYAPSFKYDVPDTDAEETAENEEKARQRKRDAREALLKTIDHYRATGMLVTQDIVESLAREYGVCPAPQLAPTLPAAPAAPSIKEST